MPTAPEARGRLTVMGIVASMSAALETRSNSNVGGEQVASPGAQTEDLVPLSFALCYMSVAARTFTVSVSW